MRSHRAAACTEGGGGVSFVYAVSTGYYSDYRIVAMFSTEEAAKQYAAAYPMGSADVEIYELDQENEATNRVRLGLKQWSVRMDKAGNGTADHVDPTDEDVPRRWLYWHHEPWFALKGAPAWPTSSPPSSPWKWALNGYWWAADEQGAIKAANELRAQLIATGRWPEDQPHVNNVGMVVTTYHIDLSADITTPPTTP